MGCEQPARYYDEIYLKSREYKRLPTMAPWTFLWQSIAEYIDPSDSVLDVGCGPGHLAGLLVPKVQSKYVGIDFSAVAIRQAKERVPGVTFRCRNVFETEWPEKDVYIFCEVLEHVHRDLELVRRVPVGKWVIISVPDFDSEGHVRHFRDLGEAEDRYSEAIDVLESTTVESKEGAVWFLIIGRRRVDV